MKNKIYFAHDIFPVFLNFDFVFSQVLLEITIYKNSNFIQLSPLSPPIVEKLNQIKKMARENFLNLSGFPKHSLFFS